jgi:hypothetical protein
LGDSTAGTAQAPTSRQLTGVLSGADGEVGGDNVGIGANAINGQHARIVLSLQKLNTWTTLREWQ